MMTYYFKIVSLVLRYTPLDREVSISSTIETLEETFSNRNVDIEMLDATLEQAARCACRFAQAIALTPVDPDIAVWAVYLRYWGGKGEGWTPIVAIGTRDGIEIIHGEGLNRFGTASCAEYALIAVKRYTQGGLR